MTNELNAIRGAAEDGKDFLVKEFKSAAGDANALMDDVAKGEGPWRNCPAASNKRRVWRATGSPVDTSCTPGPSRLCNSFCANT